jgi:hypothetical protein
MERESINITFNSSVEFYNFIQEKGLYLLSEKTREFYDAYRNVSRGCGCSRRKRHAAAGRLYLEVPSSLDEHRQYLLYRVLTDERTQEAQLSGKDNPPIKDVIFMHENEKFAEFNYAVKLEESG